LNFCCKETISVVGTSPDKKKSTIYMVKKDSKGRPNLLTAVRASDMQIVNSIPSNKLSDVVKVVGVDANFYYTFESALNYSGDPCTNLISL